MRPLGNVLNLARPIRDARVFLGTRAEGLWMVPRIGRAEPFCHTWLRLDAFAAGAEINLGTDNFEPQNGPAMPLRSASDPAHVAIPAGAGNEHPPQPPRPRLRRESPCFAGAPARPSPAIRVLTRRR